MPITYEQLENRSGTIYNKSTGQAYGEGLTEQEANKQLASDLGTQPHLIDWTNENLISKEIKPEAFSSDLSNLNNSEFKIPTVDPFAGNAVDMTSGYGAISKFYSDQAANIAAQTEAIGGDQQDIMDEIKTSQEERESRTDLTSGAFADIGIDAKDYFSSLQAGYDEIGGLQTQYNNIEAEMNDRLGIIEGRQTTMNLIEGEQAVTRTKYERRLSKINSDISSKAAVLQAKQGLFGEARQFVKEAVDSAIYDQEKEFETLSKFVEINQEIIDGLNDDYKDSIYKSLENAQKAYEEIKSEKGEVGDLMIEYAEAGINLNMSLDEAKTTAQDYLAATGGTEDFELRTVGNSLYAINPRTLEKTLIATAPQDSGVSPYQQWQIDKYNYEDQKELLSGFYSDMNDAGSVMEGYSPVGYKTREALINELQSKYPDLVPQDIESEVYKHYSDLTPEQAKEIKTKGTPYYFPVFPGSQG